jgi:hypothetical protein
MRNKIIFITMIVGHAISALGQTGLEQYYYVQKKQPVVLVPVFHFQSSRNWYVEARYNYEELRSASVYIGKNFVNKNESDFSWSATPILGVIGGRFKGGSAGINVNMEYGRVSFCSQSQFSFAPKSSSDNFIFSWSEVAIEPLPWLFVGASVQYTRQVKSRNTMIEEGLVLGFNFRNWTFPVYGFNLTDSQPYFILGINLGIGLVKKHE